MKGFLLDSNGDVVIKSGKIQMTEGDDLVRQTIRTVLGTNKGEWVFDQNEGINFKNILGKMGASSENESSENKALKQYYENILEDTSELSARLAKRLDGET